MSVKILRMISAEVNYFKYEFILILTLLFSYTVFMFLDLHLFADNYFLSRYFWSAFIGLGFYLLVYIIWTRRMQEKRDRLYVQLPVSITELSFARIGLILAPLFLAISYLVLIHLVFVNNWVEHTIRIFAQIGIFFMAMPLLLFMFDLWFSFSFSGLKYRVPVLVLVLSFISLSTIFVLFYIIIPFYRKVFSAGEEITFFLWGFLLNFLLLYSFRKRKSYL